MLFRSFPEGTVWGNPYEGRGHDMVLAGQVEPLAVDLDAMEDLFRRADFETVNQSLTEVGLYSYVDLFATYAGRARDLKPWAAGAAINRDSNLRMQYLAGLGLNLDESDSIYQGILKYRQFPPEMFHSKEGRDQSIRLKLQAEFQP